MVANAEARTKAAISIQQWARRVKSGSHALSRFPTMAELKAKFAQYFDRSALEAGAEDGEFYTPAAIMAREAAREDAVVQSSLTAAWDACLAAAGAEGMATTDSTTGQRCLTKAAYFAMTKKLYLAEAATSDEDSACIDAEECIAACEAGWTEDAAGSDTLSEAAFKHAWWVLCDLHTTSVRADDYAGWLRATVAKVTSHDPCLGVVGWRNDREQLEAIEASLKDKPRRLRRFHKAERKWTASFALARSGGHEVDSFVHVPASESSGGTVNQPPTLQEVGASTGKRAASPITSELVTRLKAREGSEPSSERSNEQISERSSKRSSERSSEQPGERSSPSRPPFQAEPSLPSVSRNSSRNSSRRSSGTLASGTASGTAGIASGTLATGAPISGIASGAAPGLLSSTMSSVASGTTVSSRTVSSSLPHRPASSPSKRGSSTEQWRMPGISRPSSADANLFHLPSPFKERVRNIVADRSRVVAARTPAPVTHAPKWMSSPHQHRSADLGSARARRVADGEGSSRRVLPAPANYLLSPAPVPPTTAPAMPAMQPPSWHYGVNPAGMSHLAGSVHTVAISLTATGADQVSTPEPAAWNTLRGCKLGPRGAAAARRRRSMSASMPPERPLAPRNWAADLDSRPLTPLGHANGPLGHSSWWAAPPPLAVDASSRGGMGSLGLKPQGMPQALTRPLTSGGPIGTMPSREAAVRPGTAAVHSRVQRVR